MLITATFLGSLVSMGFEPGQQYTLQLVTPEETRLRIYKLINTAYPFQQVPYSTMATLLDNWGSLSKCK